MATLAASLAPFPAIPPCRFPSLPSPSTRMGAGFPPRRRSGYAGQWRAMVQPQKQASQGPSSAYAREMERLSAKESLLLAFKDAGGFESLASGRTTEIQRIDVNERIVSLEKLNPTTRPTTSPFLEGRWNFEWFSVGSPGSLTAKVLFERSPATLANLLKLDLLIKNGYSKITANIKFLNSIESKFLITTKLSVEGPMRIKEEYVEGTLETPTVSEESIPEQLKGAIGQASGSLQQLPVPIRDTISNGLKLPLSGIFQRMFMISYLDEEILIIRDSSGAPDVLTRLEEPQNTSDTDPVITEYES